MLIGVLAMVGCITGASAAGPKGAIAGAILGAITGLAVTLLYLSGVPL